MRAGSKVKEKYIEIKRKRYRLKLRTYLFVGISEIYACRILEFLDIVEFLDAFLGMSI